MPVIKGNWYGPDGKPFTDDGQMQIGERQGQRCRRRGHLTKRLNHPELFPAQKQLAYVSRYWKEHISAAAKAAWSRGEGLGTNRAGKEFKRYAQLMYMSAINPLLLLDIDFYAEMHALAMIHVKKVAAVYYDPPSRGVWFHAQFYRYSDADYKSEILIYQVKPMHINRTWNWQFAKRIGTMNLVTAKIWPDVQDADYFLPCKWLPQPPLDTLQFVGRHVRFYSDMTPPAHISHYTVDTVPKVFTLPP